MFELEKALENLECCASERGHFRPVSGTAQHSQDREQQDLDQIVAGILGSRIGNALERGQEELHRRPPRIGGSPLKNPLFAALQALSAQVKCDSPALEWGGHLRRPWILCYFAIFAN